MRAVMRMSLLPVVLLLPLLGSAADGTSPTAIGAEDAVTPELDVFELKNGVYACRSCRPPYEIMADGLDHPVIGRSFYDTVSVRIVDAFNVIRVAKKKGAIVAEINNSISRDGHILTVRAVLHSAGSSMVWFTQDYERVLTGAPGSHALSGEWRKVYKKSPGINTSDAGGLDSDQQPSDPQRSYRQSFRRSTCTRIHRGRRW